ncbi:unnamed protein product [Onchocerca flexuosa]|uniref:Uncharacterized protein n=1 Tax=Onchocerca flexuosa TaxID=387005 RepID=A0A183HTG8_9BILA|nr:unnamed protein product [Onchocerca flexuosa]
MRDGLNTPCTLLGQTMSPPGVFMPCPAVPSPAPPVRRRILPLATRLLVYSNQLHHFGSKLEEMISRNPHLYHYYYYYSISFFPTLLPVDATCYAHIRLLLTPRLQVNCHVSVPLTC